MREDHEARSREVERGGEAAWSSCFAFFAALREFVIQELIGFAGVVIMPTNGINDSDRGEIVIYQPPSGAATLDVRLTGETLWLTQPDR